ncbi:MAG: dethiobiotin synthase [Azoarcus sp.]|jgi:dethiobiotin synthetase|nr:dethiobiotin synthase [Azoarcus sp.]
MNHPFRAWFVTGTDTGVGKTFATCALIHAARAQGYVTLGMKPVAAGAESIDGQLTNEDTARLRAAGSFDPGQELITPYCLRTPVSPQIAAWEEKVRIETGPVLQAFNNLQQRCERLFVEGVGGLLVPLGDDIDAADIARELRLPVILVVGMRLGCINHTLLTVEALAARNLRLAGWIANALEPDMPYRQKNIDILRQRLDAPLLGVLPYAPETAHDALARFITLPA